MANLFDALVVALIGVCLIVFMRAVHEFGKKKEDDDK